MGLKSIYTVVSPKEKHWVGDGFYVSTPFSPHQLDYKYTTPFILMDHAAPKEFAPTEKNLELELILIVDLKQLLLQLMAKSITAIQEAVEEP